MEVNQVNILFDPDLLPISLYDKWRRLLDVLHTMESAVVAFSGGVDSGLLCVAAYKVMGIRMLAVTIHSPVDPPGDREAARKLAQEVHFPHREVQLNDLANKLFVSNSPERCYYCKMSRLQMLHALARENGFQEMLEGTNAEDGQDYRPGHRAVTELGARSPLAEVGLTKSEIRSLAKSMGLSIWNRPSAPCLATRFPYGTPITTAGLRQVGQAEKYLMERGYEPVRVRFSGPLARIEVSTDQIERLVSQRNEIVERFKQLGFKYVTVDLQGYRTGSLNEVLPR